MSRVSVLESMYSVKKSPLEFNYDMLCAPPILAILDNIDIGKLYNIATSVRYNGNINKKYRAIDEVMKRRGFIRANKGTNRIVYNFMDDQRFVAKVAIDKAGIKDNPAEYFNQRYFKPFCCKIFETDRSGVVGFIERVNPITSIEEFYSVADDIYNMIITKIIGKYVVDDIGTSKFMNFGLRMNGFGPVILDFPYAYELDGNKLCCLNKVNGIVCGGEIDYDAGFNYLRCEKCGKVYSAKDLEIKKDKEILILNDKGGPCNMNRVRILDENGKVILTSEASTKTYATKNQFISHNTHAVCSKEKELVVDRVDKIRRKSREQKKQELYTELMKEYYTGLSNLENRPFEKAFGKEVEVDRTDNVNESPKKQNITPSINKPESSVEVVESVIPSMPVPTEDAIDNEEVDNAKYIEDNDKQEEAIEESVINEDESNIDTNENIDLSSFKIGSEIEDEEPDYSNYVPEENDNTEEYTDDYNDDNEMSFSDYKKQKPYVKRNNASLEDY